jgi:hypothetical protein
MLTCVAFERRGIGIRTPSLFNVRVDSRAHTPADIERRFTEWSGVAACAPLTADIRWNASFAQFKSAPAARSSQGTRLRLSGLPFGLPVRTNMRLIFTLGVAA